MYMYIYIYIGFEYLHSNTVLTIVIMVDGYESDVYLLFISWSTMVIHGYNVFFTIFMNGYQRTF